MPPQSRSKAIPTGGTFKTDTELKVEKLFEEKEATLKKDPKFNREMKFFLPNDPAADQKIDENEFLLTGDDMKKLSMKRKADQDAPQMLKTKAMKEYERLQAVKVYSKSIVRVILPNQCILQACFHPREPLGAVVKFVKECLASSQAKFQLLTGHPLKELKAEGVKTSIVAEGLTPSAVLHFRWLGEAPHGPLLKEHITAGISHDIPVVEKPVASGPTLADAGGSSPAKVPKGSAAAQRTAEAKKAVEDRLKVESSLALNPDINYRP